VIAELGALEQSARELTFTGWLERWHDFYLLAGTAAVTLAGLLFVALSLHIDQLVEESHEHLLGLSRSTLLSFIVVMLASLFMLVPPMGPHMTGLMISALGATGLVLTIVYAVRTRHHEEGGFTRQQVRRRLLFPALGYMLMLFAGIGVHEHNPEMLYQMIGAICMILGNAAGTSWELLVRVARQKRATQQA
jgi:hypothetical protein